MTEQYYTPSLEDFRPGFKCELRDPDFQGQSDGGEWKEMSSASNIIADVLLNWKHFQDYRVPYLAADQIEVEGFVMDQMNWNWNDKIMFYNYTSMSSDTTKMIVFYYYIKERIIRIYKGKGGYTDSGPDMKQIYEGTCRCINDFRLICKLLNIK